MENDDKNDPNEKEEVPSDKDEQTTPNEGAAIRKLGRTRREPDLRRSLNRSDDRGSMPKLFPVRFLLAPFAGWVNRHHAHATAYLMEENRMLEEQLGGKSTDRGEVDEDELFEIEPGFLVTLASASFSRG